MANKRQRKKAATREGKKNLKVNDSGMIINQHGVKFTPEEKRALVNAVERVNYKRGKMLKAAATLPRLHAGVDTGDVVGSRQAMGFESDFIITSKSKSLQRFHSKAQYKQYMRYLDRVQSDKYLDDRIRAYKHNFTKTLLNVYGDEAKDIAMKIRMMKPREYMEMVEKDETLEIGYVIPSDSKVAGRLNEVRRALGMQEKTEFPDEEYDIEE